MAVHPLLYGGEKEVASEGIGPPRVTYAESVKDPKVIPPTGRLESRDSGSVTLESEPEQKDAPEGQEGEAQQEEVKKSSHVQRKVEKRQEGHKLDAHIEEQFGGGRLLACISSRPGQCGRADGYIIKGKELEFYLKKIQRKKGKGTGAAA
ncbi:hypothetical protein IEQ34_002952 [Dendrobium chrysotoxum]|uniref:40S ribosomal protein S8 n=1 Tax=Dendrobium chrysotoxum TaxID=161865 RepID=A0AAV7HIF2_DENCH|nr:hypothetical protein IEQ34_002952 [Dendrobium chrysotoxum]